LDDITLGFGNMVGVFYQNANHTFDSVVTYYSGQVVDGLALGDLNNDGLLDIAVSHMYNSFISVFLQDQGTFTSQTYSHPAAGNNELNIGDLNGDGLADVLLMPGQFSSSLYLFTQNASGQLNPYVSVPTGFPSNLYHGSAIGDLNGDGLNDVVATLTFDDAANIWYQDSTNHALVNLAQVQTGSLPDPVEVADVDCDGNLEMLVMRSGTIASFQQDGNHVFGPYTSFLVPYSTSHEPQAFAIGDLNSDGRPDMITATYQGVSILYNRTMPSNLDSVIYHVAVDTTFTDTAQYGNYLNVIVTDTVLPYLINTSSWYNVEAHVRLDSVRTDSLVLSYGILCGGQVVDSVYTSSNEVTLDTLSTDTTFLYSITDTLMLGVNHWENLWEPLQIFPNPTNGPLWILAANEQTLLDIGYSIMDSSGRPIVNGKLNSLPAKLDLRNITPGLYFLRINLSNGLRVTPIVLSE
jgi:hypothetical protein